MNKLKQFFTIGMAGHIDHGKTTLTNALTGVNTDRLKEEQERNISIELGYALFAQSEKLEIAIVDVPGHERFIRQMIAGVAGIDFVMLIIAADEGVMPQTEEHINILSLLGIERGVVVMTKIDQVDDEWLRVVSDDVKETLQNTFLQNAPIFYVDSVSRRGIEQLKNYLIETIPQLQTKNREHSFRLPIDQVFTIKGQGVIVRGTVFNGVVHEGDSLTVLPTNKKVRVRQIQSHFKERKVAYAGQRAAINLGGISLQEIKRGDVLVNDNTFIVSNRIDVVLYPLKTINYRVLQRLNVKVHIGTSEVNGKIIFFDRNELFEKKSNEVLCQLQLDDSVVVTRKDRFIVRRATPVETIGGGWVIEPNANKYRFGFETINQLRLKKDGSARERIIMALNEHVSLSFREIVKKAAVTEKELHDALHLLVEILPHIYTTQLTYDTLKEKIVTTLKDYHKQYPLRQGINKAEMISTFSNEYSEAVVEFTLYMLKKDKVIELIGPVVSLTHFIRTYPSKWSKKLKQIEKTLIKQGANLEEWNQIVSNSEIPDDIITDFYHYLIETEKAYLFDEGRLISKKAVVELIVQLEKETGRNSFNLQTARSILGLSRKNLIPLLELSDKLGYTKRDGNVRVWH